MNIFFSLFADSSAGVVPLGYYSRDGGTLADLIDEDEEEEDGSSVANDPPVLVVGAASAFDAAPRFVYGFDPLAGRWFKVGRRLLRPRIRPVAMQVPNSYC